MSKINYRTMFVFFNLLCVGNLFPMWYYIFNIYCLQTNCKSKYAYWLFCACIFLPFLAGTYWVISASSIAFPISSGICVKYFNFFDDALLFIEGKNPKIVVFLVERVIQTVKYFSINIQTQATSQISETGKVWYFKKSY